MKLIDLKTELLLPAFMQKDTADKALAESFDEIIRALAPRIRLLTMWDQIDSMSNAELDEMAWELNVSWYLTSADIRVKRQLIKEADLIHASLGTKYAVEEVITAYFGNGVVQEWFEYDGEPFHFRVYTMNPTVITEKQREFLHILNIVKRRTAVLDEIIMGMTAEMNIIMGVAYQEASFEATRVERVINDLVSEMAWSMGVAYQEATKEITTVGTGGEL
jgi:phage tail P2-like protein